MFRRQYQFEKVCWDMFAIWLVWSMMHHALFIVIVTGKLQGKPLADGDNLSYVNLVCSQMWLKRLKTKRTQSTLNINTFSSNQTLKWEHNLAWLLPTRILPCMKWFSPLSSPFFCPNNNQHAYALSLWSERTCAQRVTFDFNIMFSSVIKPISKF